MRHFLKNLFLGTSVLGIVLVLYPKMVLGEESAPAAATSAPPSSAPPTTTPPAPAAIDGIKVKINGAEAVAEQGRRYVFDKGVGWQWDTDGADFESFAGEEIVVPKGNATGVWLNHNYSTPKGVASSPVSPSNPTTPAPANAGNDGWHDSGIPGFESRLVDGKVQYRETGGDGTVLTNDDVAAKLVGRDSAPTAKPAAAKPAEEKPADPAAAKPADPAAAAGAGTPSSSEAQKQLENAAQGGGEEEESSFGEKVKEALVGNRTITYNYAQYALVILEAVMANRIKDATKEVKIKGADALGDSQGTPNTTYATYEEPSTPMSGTTLTDSITTLVDLLKTNTIDISLLSEDFEKKEEKEAEITEAAPSIMLGESSSQMPTTTTTTSVTSGSAEEEEEEDLTTEQESEIRKRRLLMAMEWAVAAEQIGEGSNAISSKFYDRVDTFVSAANSANGSLGGISTINDTDRFVLFELTRSAALSAIQLGLQASVTFSEIKVRTEVPKTKTPSTSEKSASSSASSQ